MEQPLYRRDLDREDGRPYFVWEEPITVGELRRLLRDGDQEERLRWTARILRDARFEDVWRFLTAKEVARAFEALRPRLGRRAAFWAWMLDRWRADGLLD